ncbi:MAG: arsenical pump-driving ATPase [Gemmatimonadaceae bacterium]
METIVPRIKGLDALLETLPPWVLVAGKGGVGKSTCASAIAARLADRGEETLLLSTDPAASLGDAIGIALDSSPRGVAGAPRLFAAQLEAGVARSVFLERWRDVIVTIVDRGTYLDQADAAGMVDAALPGADEAMALLTLADIARASRWRRVVVDTAPTGHTLRLLSLPATFRALIRLLEAMQGKHRFMVEALTPRSRGDAADAVLGQMHGEIDALSATLHDRARCAAVLVARPDDVVAAETVRYAARLPELEVSVAALVVNAVPVAPSAETRAALHQLRSVRVPTYVVPLLDDAPMGLESIAAWGRTVTRDAGADVAPRSARRAAAGATTAGRIESAVPGAVAARSLTIVAGKGGVGKTTAACALALAATRDAAPVLLVSTDPAPSVADVLGQDIGDADVAVHGTPGLFARQMDAPAAFARVRDEYQQRVDGIFDSIFEGGMDAAQDRAIVRDLFALAPPGIDEIYALAALGETVSEGRYATVIVDPAPTGHLLRLLEMPEMGLEWSHRLMRLMLKYKRLVGLSDTAAELLAFAKRTRGVQTLLHDATRCGILVVALDEPLVRAETVRVVAAARAREIAVLGILWNRTGKDPAPLPILPPVAQFVAAAVVPPPRGLEALRRWRDGWTPLVDGDG